MPSHSLPTPFPEARLTLKAASLDATKSSPAMTELEERVRERIRDWKIQVIQSLDTESSVVVFGTRADKPVVLKVLRGASDEWHSGEVLDAFGGYGMVRIYEHVEGAVLLEGLHPATQLAVLSLGGRDEEATEILAGVIERLRPLRTLDSAPTVSDWGMGFIRYLASGDGQIPKALVERGERVYFDLAASQKNTRLLHGDLQHYNILFDSVRGWVAIDPKGVIGETEYEIGASLRNPAESPELFASPAAIERRIGQYEAALHLDAHRMLAWGFAEAVLSAIWLVEDGYAVNSGTLPIVLAGAIGTMLDASPGA